MNKKEQKRDRDRYRERKNNLISQKKQNNKY